MDSFELNKIAGAVLFALLVALGLSIFSEIIFETETPETPGYAIAVAESGEGGHGAAGGGEAPASQPIAVLLATADAAAGEADSKKCIGCHTFAQGESNKTGPNLWEIVNRPIASHEGYEYSEPMHAFAEQAKTWDYEHLNAFLQNPQGTVPKTKMSFPGLKDDEERANMIAYLRTLAASPAALPQAAAAEAAAPAEAAGAEHAAPAETAAAAPAEAAPQGGGEPAAAAPAAQAIAPAEQQAAQPEPAPAAPAPAETAAPAQPAAPAETQTAQPAETPPAPAAPAEQQVAQQEPAPAAPAPAAPAAAPAGGFAALVAAGDVAKGTTFAKRCAACHTFEKDGANKVGPHLWGIVDRPIASVADFEYSPAMTAFAAGKTWTYDELSAYLENPKAHIPENKMAFPGVKKEEDRANLVAYLRTLADTPAPLPAQ